jgi:uncharacterized protein (DUF4213/DUF364 family)
MDNNEILRAIWAGIDDALVLEDLHIFMHWIITKSRRYALANFFQGMPGLDLEQSRDTYLKDLLGRPVKKIIRDLLGTRETLRLSTGISCLNSALPVPEEVFDGNAIDPFRDAGRRLKTCFIGHFPDADRWREQNYPVNVIELFPQPGDIHWDRSHEALAEADLVFITGLTLVNGTFPEVIRRTPNARYRVLMGPTVPLSPMLFDYGVHLVGSTVILDVDRAVDCCRWGAGSFIFKPEGIMRRVNLTCIPELEMWTVKAHSVRKVP